MYPWCRAEVDPDEWWSCMTLATRWSDPLTPPACLPACLPSKAQVSGDFRDCGAPGPKRYFPAVFRYLGTATRAACVSLVFIGPTVDA